MGPHKPSAVGNLGEKVFINLVSLSKNSKEESLFVDGFTRFDSAYSICNKEAGLVARVLI